MGNEGYETPHEEGEPEDVGGIESIESVEVIDGDLEREASVLNTELADVRSSIEALPETPAKEKFIERLGEFQKKWGKVESNIGAVIVGAGFSASEFTSGNEVAGTVTLIITGVALLVANIGAYRKKLNAMGAEVTREQI